MKLQALDLFCGQGGASKGLHDAGFDVTGVDIEPQSQYPFRFFQANALTFDLTPFDFIWASPPCQFASTLTPKEHRSKHENLIPAIRERLIKTGVPFIIENVENARFHLRSPIKLCGTMFGLTVFRHRYFEAPHLPLVLVPPCRHDFHPVCVSGSPRRRDAHGFLDRSEPSTQERRDAMRIQWMTRTGLDQAIPPAYSEFLGRQLISVIGQKEAT